MRRRKGEAFDGQGRQGRKASKRPKARGGVVEDDIPLEGEEGQKKRSSLEVAHCRSWSLINGGRSWEGVENGGWWNGGRVDALTL